MPPAAPPTDSRHTPPSVPPPGTLPPRSQPTTNLPPPVGSTARARDWRGRLPELVAGTGLLFIAAAMVGFLSSTWVELTAQAKALLLLATAAGLSASAVMADGRARAVARLGNVVWAAGSVTLASALVVGGTASAPDQARVVLALAGLVGIGHAGWRLRARPDAWVLLVTSIGLGVLAAGPPGSAMQDSFATVDLDDVLLPLAGLLDVTLGSSAYALTGPLHALLGLAVLAAARRLPPTTATSAKVAGTMVLWYAAAELNILDAEVGAVAALLIVLGHLAHGLVADDTLLVVMGTLGALLAGTRVVTSLFSGEVAVTLAVFAAGIGMLAWAWRATQRRGDDDAAASAGADGGQGSPRPRPMSNTAP